MFSMRSPHRCEGCSDRSNKLPFAPSPVNNSSLTDVCVSATSSCSLIVSAFSHFPPRAEQEFLCLCRVTFLASSSQYPPCHPYTHTHTHTHPHQLSWKTPVPLPPPIWHTLASCVEYCTVCEPFPFSHSCHLFTLEISILQGESKSVLALTQCTDV